ncbi:MAG: peptide chain release factor N(5)-glutamine methyltransferase [Flavobacteriales bacterium]|nr:peptide chain release factor N(5)-glutamine methyltransferase [Flavobacteriales bacterium]
MFVSDNKLGTLSHYVLTSLGAMYEQREAMAIRDRLLEYHTGYGRAEMAIRRDEGMSESTLLAVKRSLRRLLSGEPIQYIIGFQWFCGMELTVSPAVLIPRPETEELVHAMLERENREHLVVFDVGTGSGCIALALKKMKPTWEVHACDISPEALEVAKRNAEQNAIDVIFHQLDILARTPDFKVDILVSNPPYIPIAEKASLPALVVNNEPALALFVDDALIYYRRLAALSQICLKPGGRLMVEIHERYSAEVLELLASAGLSNLECYRDMQGKDRGVFGMKK